MIVALAEAGQPVSAWGQTTVVNPTTIEFVTPDLHYQNVVGQALDIVLMDDDWSTELARLPSAFTVTAVSTPRLDSVSPPSSIAGQRLVLLGRRYDAGSSTYRVELRSGAQVVASMTPDQVIGSEVDIYALPDGSAYVGEPLDVVLLDGTTEIGVLPAAFMYRGPPTITGISPASGPTGTEITVTGTGLGTDLQLSLRHPGDPDGVVGLSATSATDTEMMCVPTFYYGDGEPPFVGETLDAALVFNFSTTLATLPAAFTWTA